MKTIVSLILSIPFRALICCVLAFSLLFVGTSLCAEEVSFKSQIAPILVRRCLGCHDHRIKEGGYGVQTFERMMRSGDSGEAPIVPGNPEKSFLLEKLTEADESLRMPQEDDALPDEVIALFRDWISQGAKFDGADAAERLRNLLPPRVYPAPPEVYPVPIPIFALKFSSDGNSLYTGGLHEILVWDVRTGELVKRIAGLPQRIHAIEFTSDQKTLVVAGGAPGDYGEIRLVDLLNDQMRTLAVWEDLIMSVAISADGRTLVAGGADNSVRAYDLQSNLELWRARQHVDWVTDVAVTDYRFAELLEANEGLPDFFKLSEDDKATGKHVRQHWLFDDRYIFREANWELEVVADQVKSLTDISISGIGRTYKVERKSIAQAEFPDHQPVIDHLRGLHAGWSGEEIGQPLVISASRDRTVKVFWVNDGELFTTYKGHRREFGPLKGMYRVYGVANEPGTRRVWSGGEGQHFHGWNPVTVRDEDGTAADMEERFSKAYSTDHLRHDFNEPVFQLVRGGDFLFAESADGQVKQYAIKAPLAVFDINQTKTIKTFAGQSDQLYALDVNPSAQRIAAAGFRGEVVIWDTETGEPSLRFLASPGQPTQNAIQALDSSRD